MFIIEFNYQNADLTVFSLHQTTFIQYLFFSLFMKQYWLWGFLIRTKYQLTQIMTLPYFIIYLSVQLNPKK